MPWNAEKYNEFKDLRYQPFFDLLPLIADRPGMRVIDLGCGTGELTGLLAAALTDPFVLGIDNSASMLTKAPTYPGVLFLERTIEQQLEMGDRFDLVFANASVQWLDDHAHLFPKLTGLLNKDGQLAIQMPAQTENTLNQLLLALARERPWSDLLQGWVRESPVLSLDEYASIFFNRGGQNITVMQKVYPQIAGSVEELYDFIAGSAMVPYMERLEPADRERFSRAFKRRISAVFPVMPSMYAFKRIILYARFS